METFSMLKRFSQWSLMLVALLSLGNGKMPSGEIPVLAAASVKDKAKLQTSLTNLLAKGNLTATTETYNGATLYTINLFVINLAFGVSDTKFFFGGSPAIVKAA